MSEPTIGSSLAVPQAAGIPSLAQGAYGDRGNLELAYADPADGLWVCWFNGDAPTAERAADAVPPGAWSGGLRFATGHRYRAISLIQARRGPDFLEGVALAADALHRWTWSPGPGFERTDELPPAGVRLDRCAVSETDDGFVVVASGADAGLVWRASDDGYPRLRWSGPTSFALPAGSTDAALRCSAEGVVDGLAVAASRLWRCDDVEAAPWRDIGTADDATRVCAVVAGRLAEPGPAYVIASRTRLSVVRDAGAEALLDLSAGVRADALAAATATLDRDSLEVVLRHGAVLHHVSV